MRDEKLHEIYEKLKAEQLRIEPVLSIRRMAKILGHESHSYIQRIIPKLIAMGLVEKMTFGSQVRYRIIVTQRKTTKGERP